MALQEKLRSRVAPFLEPGEEIHHVILAEAGASPWMRLGVVIGFGVWVMLLLMRPLIIAVTDRSVVVLRAGRIRSATAKSVLARLPRQTRLGPAGGAMWAKVHVAGQRLWIHRRFFKDVAAADAPLLAPPPTPAAAPPAAAGVQRGWGFDEPPEPPEPGERWPSARPPTGAWSEGAAQEPSAPPPRYAGVSAWDAPAQAQPAFRGTWPLETRGRGWQWALAGVGGLVTLVVAIGVVGTSNEMAAREQLAAYVAGTERQEFVAADGRFRAEFPDRPSRKSTLESAAGFEIETIVYQRDVGLDTSFLISYVDIPAIPGADLSAALAGTADRMASNLEARILTSSPTEFAGRPALDFLLESRLEGGTKDVHYGHMVLIVDAQRLYTVGVLGPKNPPEGFEAFFASFTIQP